MQIKSHQDLLPDLITHANLMVQFNNLPHNALTREGLPIMGKDLGTIMSPPMKGFVNGKHFYKFKISMPISEPLQESVTLAHPTMGDIKLHCSYERISRVCTFCARLEHEISGCMDHQRLIEISQRPDQQARFHSLDILEPKVASWITNPFFIPTSNPTSPNRPSPANNKRPLSPSAASQPSPSTNHTTLSAQFDKPKEIPLQIASFPLIVPIKKLRPARQVSPLMDK